MKIIAFKLVAFGILLVLAGTSFALSYAHLGHAALPVALGIAALKAAVVGIVFMEIGREQNSFKLALVAAVVLLAVLLTLVSPDVTMRGTPPLPPPMSHLS